MKLSKLEHSQILDHVRSAVTACLVLGAKKATAYISPTLVVKMSRVFEMDGRERSVNMVLTVGSPNYTEKEFIALCNKARDPFPVKKIQLKWYPDKKK